MHGQNGLKFGTLMYLDHLQYWLYFGHSLLICLILAAFYLVKEVKIIVSRHFLESALEEWPEIWHGGVSWPDESSTSQNNTMLSVCECKAVLLTMQKLDTKTLGHHIMYLLAVSSGTLSDRWFSARLLYLKCNRKQILVCCHWQLNQLKERRQCSLEKS